MREGTVVVVSPAKDVPGGVTQVCHSEHYHHEEYSVNRKVATHNKILTSLLAGAVAGAVAKTTIAPLDRTKIMFQISGRQYSLLKAVQFLYQSARCEGLLVLWRGNSATMARIIPYAAIQYTAHEQFKMMLRTEDRQHLSPGPRFLAGSMAGVTSVICTYPLDVVRARMAVTAKNRYCNIVDALLKIHREEGFRTLYRAFVPTLFGSFLYAGSSFFTYETLKKIHAERFNGCDPSPLERLCFGACAGVLGQTMSYPLDIVRRRMQTAGVSGRVKEYSTVLSTARVTVAEEGVIRGLYKGLSMNWIKGPIAVGVSFMIFDLTQRWLRRLDIFRKENSR